MLHIYHTSETNLLEFTDRVTGLAPCCLVAEKTEEKQGNGVVMLLGPSVTFVIFVNDLLSFNLSK